MSRIRGGWTGIPGSWGVRIGGLFLLLLLLPASGCGGPGAESTPAAPAFPWQGETLVVAAVGDPAVLPVVAAQRGEWQESRKATCRIIEKPVEPSNPAGAHVLVFAGERLGDLVDADALAVLPEALVQPPPAPAAAVESPETTPDAPRAESDALQFADVIPAVRDQVTKYGNDRMALPLGGSALVLVYDRAAFSSEANRAAARKAGLALDLPATWDDLDRLARFFHDQGKGSDTAGISLALGPDAEGVADAIFLARASALGQHHDHYSLLFDSDTMAPRIASPPFVETLKALLALKELGPAGVETFDAAAAARAFREGRAPLLIDRAECAGRWGGGKVKSVGVAALPGSSRVYEPVNKAWETGRASKLNRPGYLPRGGGWLVGVAASATGRQREAAIDFIRYLINPETSNRLRSDRDLPMLPVRGSQVAQGLLDPRSAPGVESRAWSEALSKTLLAARVVVGLRIPQAEGYLADLTRGRLAALQGEPAEKALANVAAAWSTRTEALGRDRQTWHYRRSLNSLVTTPTPPPRPQRQP